MPVGIVYWRRTAAGGSRASRRETDFARKYQFMEMNLQRRMGGLGDKIPEIQKTLDTVNFLKLRKVRATPIPPRMCDC